MADASVTPQDTKPTAAVPDYVRTRHCPGCAEILERFQLVAIPLPPEQLFLHQLREVNNTVGMSLRTFGQSTLSELQFLHFMATCPSCTLMTHWDFATDELNWIMDNFAESPIKISWMYNPVILEMLAGRATGAIKPLLDQLVAQVKPAAPTPEAVPASAPTEADQNFTTP
jgi:hypothetical protein